SLADPQQPSDRALAHLKLGMDRKFLGLERRSASVLPGISLPSVGRQCPDPLSRAFEIRLGRPPARRRRPRSHHACTLDGPGLVLAMEGCRPARGLTLKGSAALWLRFGGRNPCAL